MHFTAVADRILPSFRQFSVSAPQHLPQLCATQQKPREAESLASVAHQATLCAPVMSQYLEGAENVDVEPGKRGDNLKYRAGRASAAGELTACLL